MRSFDFVFAWAVVIAVYVLQPKSHFLFNCLCGLDAVSFKKSICIWKRKRDRVENVTTRWRSCWLRNLCRLSSWVILRFKKSENRFGRYFMCVTLLEFDFWHWLSAIHPHTQTKLVIPAGHSVVHTHRVAEKKRDLEWNFFSRPRPRGKDQMCIVASSLRILTKFRRRNSTRKLGESTHAAMNRQVAVVDDVKVTAGCTSR